MNLREQFEKETGKDHREFNEGEVFSIDYVEWLEKRNREQVEVLTKVVEAKALILPVSVQPEHQGEIKALNNIINECKQALKKAGCV